jgi:Flp pilus assembly protein TadG
MIRIRLAHRRALRSDEAGIGLIGTTMGVLMLFGLLFIALHAMLALQTRSLVNAAAWDAARSLSVADSTTSPAEAKRRVNALIPGLHPVVSISSPGDTVSVTIDAVSPGFFPGVTSFDSVRKVHRTATIRKERVR